MKKAFFLIAIFFASMFVFYDVSQSQALAQVGQIFETVVGEPEAAREQASDPNETNPGGPVGGNDNLGPGEFRVPWRCNLKYFSDTYTGHSAYSIGVNWGLAGQDLGHPVFAAADGVVVERYDPSGAIILRHDGGYYSVYFHMWPVLAHEGQRVPVGKKIGEINDRGAPPGQHHLHFNLCRNCGSDVLHQCQLVEPYTRKGCRIPVQFKGYKQDPNSNFPGTERNQYFYYDKGC